MSYINKIKFINEEVLSLEKELSKLECPVDASMTDTFNKWIEKNSSVLELSDYTREWLNQYCVSILQNADNSKEGVLAECV